MHPLAAALAPASIAILGASNNPHKVGGRPIAFMQQYGYQGRIYPINPSRQTVQNIPAYPDLHALPEVPELAIVAVGGIEGVRLVETCATSGVAVVVVMASGYGEAGAQGREWQARMVRACQAHGSRLIGPNCQGLSNFSNGVMANFSSIFHEQPGRDGPLAIIGQSGATTQSIYTLAQARGLHARYVHATGNEADVSAAELLCVTVDDPAVKAVIMYLESLNDADTLARGAALASQRGIPVILVKAGRSHSGQRAAASHTGAMASEDRLVDAFLKHHNLIRAIDPYEAVAVAALCVDAVAPQGGNLVVISNSGASCVMAADTADELQLPLLAFDEPVTHAMQSVMPAFSTVANPIDLTGALLTDRALFPGVVKSLAQAKDLHLLLMTLPAAGSAYDIDGYAQALAKLARERAVTIAVSAYQAPIRAAFRRHGLVTYEREREALQALATYADYAQRRRRTSRPHPVTPKPAPTLPALPAGTGALDEAQSLHLLQEAGIATLPFSLCSDAQAAVAAAQHMQTPVVLKGCSPDILHKSEHGLVVLNVAGTEQIRTAAERLAATIHAMRARYHGVLVTPMLKEGRELALGARIDPGLGPVVLVGDGGIYLEALNDFQLLVPPFDEAAVHAALMRLRIAPLLAGVRGEAPVDTPAFCRMAVQLGHVVLHWRDRLASIDINPVKVLAQGQGAFALDAVVELTAEAL